MPGPVSDSYDPEFGTSARANEVAEAVTTLRDLVSEYIGSDKLQDIVALAEGYNETVLSPQEEPGSRLWRLSERELRIIRFCMDRALESL